MTIVQPTTIPYRHVSPVSALMQISPVLPTPVLSNINGQPTDFTSSSETRTPLGWMQVVINGQDQTFFRGNQCIIEEIMTSEPFGYTTANIRFPAISPFEVAGSNLISWLYEGAEIEINLIPWNNVTTSGAIRLFEGFVIALTPSIDNASASVLVECQGALFQADHILAQPELGITTEDIGQRISELLNKVPGRRYNKCDSVTTGINTLIKGSWNPLLTGHISELLANSTTQDSSGNYTGQYTLTCLPGRKPSIQLKDLTTVHWTVSLGTPGILVSLTRDKTQEPTTLYGKGVDLQNNAWGNLKIPNLHPNGYLPYCFTLATNTITPGMSNGSTDSTTGVTDFQQRLKDNGISITVTGTHDTQSVKVIRNYQSSNGLTVDGIVGPQTWASIFSVGVNGSSWLSAYYGPLATKSNVEQYLYTSTGAILSNNPDFDPTQLRIERFRAYDNGTSKQDAFAFARAELARDSVLSWSGTITLILDPEEGSRWLIAAGQNMKIKGWQGGDLLVHISGAVLSPNTDTVTLTVDTKNRDLLSLDAIHTRDRSAITPAHLTGSARRAAEIQAARPIIDSELIGILPRQALLANHWVITKVALGYDGNIVSINVKTDTPAANFAMALFGGPITPGDLLANINNQAGSTSVNWGNPLTYTLVTNEAPFKDSTTSGGIQTVQQWLQDKNFIDCLGGPGQPAGYSPNKYSDTPTPALTGKYLDQGINLHFSSINPPYVWVAVWSDTSCFFSGNLYIAPQ